MQPVANSVVLMREARGLCLVDCRPVGSGDGRLSYVESLQAEVVCSVTRRPTTHLTGMRIARLSFASLISLSDGNLILREQLRASDFMGYGVPTVRQERSIKELLRPPANRGAVRSRRIQ